MTTFQKYNFDNMFEEISKCLSNTGKLKDLSKEFASLVTDESRIAYTLQLDCIHAIMDTAIDTVDPSAAKSHLEAQRLKDLGNKQFQKGNIHEAMKLYTKSLAFAELQDDSVGDLALGYANRSAALFHLKLYKECLVDINRAFESNYPKELCYKLYERKGKCFLKLNIIQSASESFNKAMLYLSESNLQGKKLTSVEHTIKSYLETCTNELNQTDEKESKPSGRTPDADVQYPCPNFQNGTHDIFQSLSEACEVEYTDNQGRFIVAKRDMSPGEIVLIEKPFGSVVLLDQADSHCYHCFRRVLNPVPSIHSTRVLFCDEHCLHAAEEYHQYEWPSLDLLAHSGVGKFGSLAMRTITKCGPGYLLQFKSEINSAANESCSPKLEGCSLKDKKYKSQEYNAIYHLVTHATDRKVHDLFKRSVMAVFLLKCLDKGRFFVEDTFKKNMYEFIGGLLLSHLQSFPCNAHEISELELNRNDVASSIAVEIGAGIYSTLSLFNHSCDPVVNRNFYGDTCVVRTIKPVSKGQEISDNYGVVYPVHSLHERQDKLQPQYYFICACQACEQDWPLYPDINYQTPLWKCSACRFPLMVDTGSSGLIKCPKCQSEENLEKKADILASSTQMYKDAFDKLMECQIDVALPIFQQHLQLLDDLVCCPWRDFNNCQEALKQCLSIMANSYTLPL